MTPLMTAAPKAWHSSADIPVLPSPTHGRTARLWKALTVFFSSLAACRVKRSTSWGGHDFDIIWGDVGTGVFLIPAEKLRACDFSEVVYNYDCG